MKKAGIKFSNDIYLSFTYDETNKNVDLIVIDKNERLTGGVTVKKAANKTTTKAAK